MCVPRSCIFEVSVEEGKIIKITTQLRHSSVHKWVFLENSAHEAKPKTQIIKSAPTGISFVEGWSGCQIAKTPLGRFPSVQFLVHSEEV